MELGEAVDRISWGEWNWKVILVGMRPLEICSSLKLYTDLLTVIKPWSGTSWGFEPQHVRVTAGVGSQKSRCNAANESQTRAGNTREMNPAWCTALQENQHLQHCQREQKPNPTCHLHPQRFQSWDNALGNKAWLQGEEFTSGQIVFQFVLGTFLGWHKEERQPAAQLRPVCCLWNGGKPRKYIKKREEKPRKYIKEGGKIKKI